MHKTTVMIVEAEPVLSHGLAIALDESGDLRVIGSADSLEKAREFAPQLHPDVMLVDPQTAGGGNDIAEEIQDLAPTVVILASADDDIDRMNRAELATFVPRELSINELINAIRRASARKRPAIYDDSRPRAVVPMPPHRTGALSELTQREIEVLELLMRGLSNRAIAEELHIAVNTVRTHTHNIQLKLNVHSNLAAVAFALGHGAPQN